MGLVGARQMAGTGGLVSGARDPPDGRGQGTRVLLVARRGSQSQLVNSPGLAHDDPHGVLIAVRLAEGRERVPEGAEGQGRPVRLQPLGPIPGWQ